MKVEISRREDFIDRLIMDKLQTQERAMTVEGMTCASCARTVRNYLEDEGKTEIYVDIPKQLVTYREVIADPSGADTDKISRGLQKLGYRVRSDTDQGYRFPLLHKFVVAALLTLPLILHHVLMLFDIGIAALGNPWVQLALATPVFAIGVQHFGFSAWGALRRGESNMDVLIFLGSTAAFVYSCIGLARLDPDFYFFETAASIITLVLLGNLLEDRAMQGTTSAIDDLESMKQETARLWMGEDRFMDLPAEDLRVGDRVLVRHGEAIPVDGLVKEGQASVNEALLTGESAPLAKTMGSKVLSGSTIVQGNLVVEATVDAAETVFNQVIRLVKAAQSEKPPIHRLADRISAIFVPVVVGISFLTLFIGHWGFGLSLSQSILNAIAVLVISCPCAMGLATPTAVIVGMGRMTRKGLLIKGAATIERLAGIRRILFDKTGTLTTGDLSVQSIEVVNGSEARLHQVILQLEARSNHPIAKALVNHFQTLEMSPDFRLQQIEEIPGFGIQGMGPEGRWYRIGADPDAKEGYVLRVTCDEEDIGFVRLQDALRPEAPQVREALEAVGFSLAVVSGDRESNVKRVGEQTGITETYAAQLPQDKHALIERLSTDSPLAMVGDGINDAPALERAHVGIAMAGATHTALQSAQVALLKPDLHALLDLFALSRLTVRTIRENLFWAFAYNIVAIPLAAMGYLNPMWGAIFMAFSDLVVIGNSIRLKYRTAK